MLNPTPAFQAILGILRILLSPLNFLLETKNFVGNAMGHVGVILYMNPFILDFFVSVDLKYRRKTDFCQWGLRFSQAESCHLLQDLQSYSG